MKKKKNNFLRVTHKFQAIELNLRATYSNKYVLRHCMRVLKAQII